MRRVDHPIVVLRTRQHLSRTELAQRAESGLGVSVRSALRIARALDATVESLFAGCL